MSAFSSLRSVDRKSVSRILHYKIKIFFNPSSEYAEGATLSAGARCSKCLEQGDKGEETSEEGAGGGSANGSSSTGELNRSRGGGGAGNVASGNGSLRLAIADLGDNSAGSSGAGSTSLGLTIADLRDNRARSSRLGLAIADLRDNGTGSRSGAGSRGLRLAITDLGDDRAGGASLGLTIADLRSNRARGSGLGLTIADLAGTAGSSLPHSLNVDGDALCASALAVQVGEATRRARVPDSGLEGERVVLAKGEAGLFPSASLYGGIELELVVAGDVTDAASLVLQDTILERKSQGTSELTGRQVTLGAGVGDIDGGDLEGSLSGGRAASRSALGHSCGSEGEGDEGLHFQKTGGADSESCNEG